jgi:hypothetical protein
MRAGLTGIQVSPFCLGTMMFGKAGNPDQADCIKIIHRVLDAGVNFIDTADVYGYSETEEIVGKALAGRRDGVILSPRSAGRWATTCPAGDRRRRARHCLQPDCPAGHQAAPPSSRRAFRGLTSLHPRPAAPQNRLGRAPPPLGGWKTSRPVWTPVEDWFGADPGAADEPAGYTQLVRRWLRSHGPGTEADLAWWLGATKAAVRRALADIEAVEVQLEDGSRAWLDPDDTDEVAAGAPWAALLPALDPTTMGWRGRGFYLGNQAGQIFDRNGNGGPTA